VDGNADGGALRNEFIPNWSSGEFEAFVDGIRELVEEVWRTEGREKEKVEEGLKGLWVEILEVEKTFWPVV
jgi:thiaminase